MKLCNTCKYFDANGYTQAHGAIQRYEQIGTCRRSPPIAMHSLNLYDGDEREEDVPDMGQWPSVLGKSNWCGEHAPIAGVLPIAKPDNSETEAACLQRLGTRLQDIALLEGWDAMPAEDRALLDLAKAAGGGRWSADGAIVWFDDGDAAMQVMNPIPVFVTHANLGHWPEAIYEDDVAAFAAAVCPAAAIAMLARIAELELRLAALAQQP